jgi:hypothetical protein
MKYALLIYLDESGWEAASPAEQAGEMLAFRQYTQSLVDAGMMRGGEALQSTPTATTLRFRDGEAVVTDGPFAETKEQLGGFYLIECESLDEAIEAASRIPTAATGSIEIRPLLSLPEAYPGPHV